MPRRDSLPFLQLLPNLVTILGLCAGLTGIRFAIEGRFELATGLLIFAAAVDGLDGLIARRLKATSDIGAELDSLSDFLCFGVAPALLVYRFGLTGDAGIGWIFALMLAICCCLRLARFNVNRDAPPDPGPARFTGVPAPAGALLALLPVFLTFSGLIDLRNTPYLTSAWLALVGLLMVSSLPTPSPKGLRIPRDKAVFVLVGMAILAGMMVSRFWQLMVIVSIAYLVVLVWSAVRWRKA